MKKRGRNLLSKYYCFVEGYDLYQRRYWLIRAMGSFAFYDTVVELWWCLYLFSIHVCDESVRWEEVRCRLKLKLKLRLWLRLRWIWYHSYSVSPRKPPDGCQLPPIVLVKLMDETFGD